MMAAGCLLMVSCNDFLDRYPYSENSSETMFTSATLAESVVSGVYSNLLYDYNSTDRTVLNWDSFSSVMDPQEGIVNLDYNYLFGTVQPNNGMFSTYWKRFYEGVNRANDVIEHINEVPDMSLREPPNANSSGHTIISALMFFGEVFRIMNGIWLRMSTQKDGKQRRQYGNIS